MVAESKKIILMVDCGDHYMKLEYDVLQWTTENENVLVMIDGKTNAAITRVPKTDQETDQEKLEFKNESQGESKPVQD